MDTAWHWHDRWRWLGQGVVALLLWTAALAVAAQPEPSRLWPERVPSAQYWTGAAVAAVDDARAAFEAGHGRVVDGDRARTRTGSVVPAGPVDGAPIVRAAECVAREAREGDTAARDQAADLVLLLDGRLTREQALAVGRNIIAGGLKFSARLPPGATLSLRVAGVCAQFPKGNAQLLLGILARILQDMATQPGGRAMRIVQAADAAEPGRSSQVPAPPLD